MDLRRCIDDLGEALQETPTNMVLVMETDNKVEVVSFCNMTGEGLQMLLMAAYKMVHDGDGEEVVN